VNASPSEAAANVVMRQQNAVVGKGEGVSSFMHIHDAAIARVPLLAASPGVYNLVDDDPSPQNVWSAAFAKFVGSPAPSHMSVGEVDGNSRGRCGALRDEVEWGLKCESEGDLGWKPRRLEWLGA
jgi:nucleoside-diphosphate-sugar epimerase